MLELFGTPFELSLRILILLDVHGETPISLNRLTNLDFCCIHGGSCNVAINNLHGHMFNIYGELAANHAKMKEAISYLTLIGYARLTFSNSGFHYLITDEGHQFIHSLNDRYYYAYHEIAGIVKMEYGALSDDKLSEKIYAFSEHSLKGVNNG